MGDTKIAWTDKVWNPTRGCSLVSAGCQSCYAMKQAHRFSGKGGAYEGLTKMTSHGPTWTGKVRTVPEALDQPLRWRKPRRIFVNSMSDLFHEDVPDNFIAKVFEVMAEASHHTFQILTKRPERMRDWLRGRNAGNWPMWLTPFPLPNVWLGVSVEDQATANERIPLLLKTPAAVRFISYEPALGSVDLCETLGMWWNQTMRCFEATGSAFNRNPNNHGERALDWVIVGGESGSKARPFDIAWARSIIAQCKAAGVACFVKQIGARAFEHVREFNVGPDIVPEGDYPFATVERAGADPLEWPPDLRVREFPANAASHVAVRVECGMRGRG